MNRIFDAHVHIYPDKIAERASQGIADFYHMPVRFGGSIKQLLELQKPYHVERFLVHSVATTPEQVASINRFIHESIIAHPDTFIGFGTLHPNMDFEAMQEEINAILAYGLRGVKLHPDFQKFYADEDKAMQSYSLLEGKLPVLIHAGDHRYDYSSPRRIANVLKAFPQLDVIAAHFGGWSQWNDAEKHLGGKRLWVDTCSSTYALKPEETQALITAYGHDRVFFGTDYPMWHVRDELEYFQKLNLPEETLQDILYNNAARFFGLE